MGAPDWRVAPEVTLRLPPPLPVSGACSAIGPGAVMFALTVIRLPFPLIVTPAGTGAAMPPVPAGPGFAVLVIVKVYGAVNVEALATVQVPSYAGCVAPKMVTDAP